MTDDLPRHYFRIRDNGAMVFRVDAENRQRRLEMEQVAVVNVVTGAVRPTGDKVLTDEDRAAIDLWLNRRRAMLARRDVDDIFRTIDHLNLTTQWAQGRADPDQLEEITDALLLAMHDLRTVLVKKKADRLMKSDETAEKATTRRIVPTLPDRDPG